MMQALPGNTVSPALRHRFLVHVLLTPLCVLSLSVLGAVLGMSHAALFALVAALVCAWSARTLLRTAREISTFFSLQLTQAQKLAAIGEIASGIAHEINTPLGVIGMEVEWMEHLLDQTGFFTKVNREMNAALHRVEGQVERCREITHKMLHFARQMDMVIQETDINELVEDMAQLVDREVESRGICVVRDYEAKLPLVDTDSPLLRQVVLNLLNNAAQSLGDYGVITVRTRCREREWLSISVEDNGPGIPEENLERIFTPFFTTREPGKGTGLGLPISLAIITRLGGTIDVESRPGVLTIFTITLPIRQGGSASQPSANGGI